MLLWVSSDKAVSNSFSFSLLEKPHSCPVHPVEAAEWEGCGLIRMPCHSWNKDRGSTQTLGAFSPPVLCKGTLIAHRGERWWKLLF